MSIAEKHESPIDRKDGFIALGLGLFSVALYARTLVPGLLPNDGGEFQTLAYTLGHAHTTGYEVYTLLAKLFTLLVPLGDPAYRVNLFSAFLGGITIAFIYLSGRVLSGSRWAGTIGALAVALSATFWSQAIIAEVYTAGSAFTSAILFLVLLWYQTGRGRWLFIAGALGGLGIGVHGSNSLFAPAILLLNLLKPRDLRKSWRPALTGALAGLALMVAAFAVVDAQPTPSSAVRAIYQPSATRWDAQPAELDTITGRFAFLVFARQWRSAMFVNPGEVVPNNLRLFQNFFARDFTLPARLLLVVGFAGLFFQRGGRWRLGLFFLAALLVHAWYTLNYRIGDIYVFFVSLYVYYGALIAAGAGVLLGLAGRLRGWQAHLARPALAVILLALTAAPVLAQRVDALKAGEMRFDFMGLPSNAELADWHKMISYNVKDLPRGAVVLMDWHDLYGYFYAANVEQDRADLQFLEAYPYANKEGMADSLLEYIGRQLAAGYPVLLANRFDEVQRGGFTLRRQSFGMHDYFIVETR